MVVRLVHENRSYVRAPGDTLETHLGVLEIPDDVTPGRELETHLGHVFQVRSLRPPDCVDHFERSGAPMLPRDIGLLIGETGVHAGDRVLDIGTGTGILAAYLGFVGASVLTFERDAEAATIARSNLEMVELTERVDVQTGDASEAIAAGDLGEFDVITLDTGDAPAFARAASDLLVPGGFLVAYSPFVETTRAVVEAARESLTDVRAIDTIQRGLDIDERGTRPSTRPVGHTGFLTVARRP